MLCTLASSEAHMPLILFLLDNPSGSLTVKIAKPVS